MEVVLVFDQDTERAITAVELDDDTRVEKWFEAICEVYEGGGDDGPVADWDSFKEALTARAVDYDSAFDNGFVDAFASEVEGLASPLDAIKEMSVTGKDHLARAYPGLLDQKRAAMAEVGGPEPEGALDVAELGWVTQAQRERLAGGIGDSWPDALRRKLDDVWPPWQDSGPDALVDFLDQWADTIVAEAAPPPRTSGAAEPAMAEGEEVEAETEGDAAEETLPEEAETALRKAVAEAHAVMKRIISENSELADLSEEDRQQALAEALQETALAGE